MQVTSEKIKQAREAGYSDAEIFGHLSTDKILAPKITQAKSAGYGEEDILKHLSATAQPDVPVGFMGDISQAITKRAGAISGELSGISALQAPSKLPLRVGGQAAGFLADIQGAALKGAYKGLVPESVQEAISGGVKSVLSTEIGQAGLNALQQGMEYYNSFKKSYPEVAKDLEAVVNIGSLYPVGRVVKAEGAIAKEGLGVAKDVVQLTRPKAPSAIDRIIQSNVKYGINKAIRPSVAGKGTQTQVNVYYNKAQEAVESIIKNKEKLLLTNPDGIKAHGLPTNLHQFSEAIEQNKKIIFEQYDNLARSAGVQGAVVDLKPIVKELDVIANNKVVIDNAPGAAQYAAERAQAFAGRGAYTASEAQDAVQILNRSLDSFYKAPSYDTASRAYIDSLVVNNIRKSLDEVIENTAGAGYQDLKKTYGALKTIEADVNRRYIVDARKNVSGLLDFTDIYTGGKIIEGLATLSPAKVAIGLGGKALATVHKMRNNPDRMIKNLFNRTEKLIEKKNTPFIPQSYTGKKIQETLKK